MLKPAERPGLIRRSVLLLREGRACRQKADGSDAPPSARTKSGARQLFFSSIPPLVVATLNSRPPPPTVPDSDLGPNLPCTVIGKSV